MSSKSISVLIVAVLLAAQASAQPAPQEEFQALLERVKKSDASVDFTRMRQLQTQLDDYEPYGLDVKENPLALVRDGKLERAQAVAQQVLAVSYLDLEAHTAAARVAEERGDKAAAAHHRYVVDGVLDSILKSGDGKTTGTAYVVITVSEEYATMGHLGLQVAEQSLLNDDAGHAYDLLKGVNPETKATQEVYFNIDSIMGAAAKMFSP
ncbi:MAG TPA: DUF4919 domain-containing protein [Thermoanaerobaculia bacterium]|nr:DUF4919 domain-containing protein [Thermoanaerobaculia bacterium]